MSLRVVNLGLPKSGTTTLAKALQKAGLTVADFRIRRHQTEDPALRGAFVAELLYRGYFETGDPAALLPGFSAISEMSLLRKGRSLWPQTDLALIRALRAHNPDLKLLASRRDPFEMSQSILAWSDLGTARLPASAIPGLPPGFGETTKERIQWIEGHYATLRQAFGDDSGFLEFNIEDPDAPASVGRFLQIDLPWWGHANANPLRRGPDKS